MNIFIDAGHGGRWPKGDPGVVSTDQAKIESEYAFLYANRLADFLSSRGYNVVKTRTQDEFKTPLPERTRMAKNGDLFISLHFDAATGGRMIYYSQHPESRKFSEDVDQFFKSKRLLPTTSSRFGRLYIDDARCPAILIEIDRINDATKDEAYIQSFCEMVEKGISRFSGSPLPFSRIFAVGKDNISREIRIEKMTLVGDKLYVRTDDSF